MNYGWSWGCVAILAFFSCLPLRAQEIDRMENFRTRNQAGIRLGAWINNGDSEPTAPPPDPSFMYEANLSDGNLFAELFYGYRFSPLLVGEFSFGIVSRGDVAFTDGVVTDYGSLMVYPILVKARLYPLSGSSLRLQPYLSIGGGLYVGSQSIRFSNDVYAGFRGGDTETDLNYSLGGGFSLPVSSTIVLDLKTEYMPITFGTPLINMTDFSAVSVTAGITYLLPHRK